MNNKYKTPIKRDTKKIIDQSIKAFGVDMNMKTDVKILCGVLKEMRLNDFETSYLPMKSFFQESISKPQDLKPMLKSIKQGLINKHPAIVEFLEKALDEAWLQPSKYIQKSLHVAFVLEAMTAAMCNSNVFFQESLVHIRLKEREVGVDNRNLFKSVWNSGPSAGSFFATAKAISLDPAMAYFRFRRDIDGGKLTNYRVKKLYKKGEMSFLEYKLLLPLCKKNACHCSDWLRMNIFEAGMTEYNNNFKENALAAHVLNEDIKKTCHREVFKKVGVFPESDHGEFYESLAEKDNYFPSFSFTQEWVSLYETWNMAFILGELNNLDFLFPKLFIPSVINSKSENFLGARIISLWLSINNILFKNFDKSEKILGPKNRREMATAWGKINKKYAQKVFKEYVGKSDSELNKSYKKQFSKLFYSLFKLAARILF